MSFNKNLKPGAKAPGSFLRFSISKSTFPKLGSDDNRHHAGIHAQHEHRPNPMFSHRDRTRNSGNYRRCTECEGMTYAFISFL